MRLLAVLSDTDDPQRLHGAWLAGEITAADLAELIPQAWTGHDRAESMIGTVAWVAMFRAAGLLVVSSNQPTPTYPQRVFRGATGHGQRGMAWTTDLTTAKHHRDRCRKQTGARALYRATVDQDAVLALFNTRREHETVIDPDHLDHIQPLSVGHSVDHLE
jgi:hypothetical protein